MGILAAVVAGAAQPLMTVVFGSLTTAFVGYQSALLTNDAQLIAGELPPTSNSPRFPHLVLISLIG